MALLTHRLCWYLPIRRQRITILLLPDWDGSRGSVNTVLVMAVMYSWLGEDTCLLWCVGHTGLIHQKSFVLQRFPLSESFVHREKANVVLLFCFYLTFLCLKSLFGSCNYFFSTIFFTNFQRIWDHG